ncbi:GNAT family N-acetyltransferase [Leucobacter komagatae]|uniref:GNAT family N-acetyltransferase n=1 Tax=Leucobacter komagatae TaxID=55969 RepID=UPI0005ACADF1|nr:GNAT family N-acetyltransferase [Leucobacter komagatae]
MQPFTLRTPDYLLDALTLSDAPAIAEYCSDPIFEAFMSTPWPYTLADAERFVGEYVPSAWANDTEWTWAIRAASGGPVLGVIGLRLPSGMLGYWLGAPHRGRRIMSAAVDAVVAAAFERTAVAAVRWEAVVGNVASARTVARAGFTYTGERPGAVLGRDGSHVQSWTAQLSRTDSATPQPGWPM